MESNCLLQDGSLFIGLISLPLGKEEETNATLEGLFEDYTKRLNKKISLYSNKKEGDTDYDSLIKFFFKEKKFYLFGKFDLAVITIIDGFSFPVREFSLKGLNLFSKEDCILDISRHTILGPTPKFNNDKDDKDDKDDKITGLHKKIYENKQLPLISITRLKLNDLCLFKNGTDFIRSVIKQINYTLKNQIDKKHQFDFIIIENYGWSEITITIFADSYNSIGDIMIKLRSLTKSDLINTLDLIDRPLKNILKAEQTSVKPDSLLFTDSHSVLGFDYDLFSNQDAIKNLISSNDEILHRIDISTKPGYIVDIFNSLKEISKLDQLQIDESNHIKATVGKSDILYYINKNKKIKTHELIRWITNFRNNKNFTSKVNRLSTTVIFHHQENCFPQGSITSNSISDVDLLKLKFNSDTLIKLNKTLGELNIPHVTKEAILNLFSIFNNKMSNSLSFASFIELRPFLTHILQVVANAIYRSKNTSNYNFKSILKWLNHSLHAFHYAYYNRVLGQYNNGDQYDQPMFFNIGSQTLVSAFDILYKSITSIVGNKASFVFVEADPEFTISDLALRLNYFHVFNPELLCAVLFQEATNQCKNRFEHEHPNLFRFHRQKNRKTSTNYIDWNLRKNGIEGDQLIREYENIITPLTPEFFEHIFSDLVGYRLFYQDNSKMYTYWSWAYFSTDINNFQNNHENLDINTKYLIPYLFRQLIVLKCYSEEEYENYEVKFDPKLDIIANREIVSLKTFLNTYFLKGEFLAWVNEIKEFAENLYKKNLLNNIGDNSQIINQIKENLIKGRVINNYSTNETDENRFLFTRNLLYAYLEAVKEVSKESKKYNIVRRQKDYENTKNEDFSNLLFDPQGGTYIVNPTIRREIYKLRSSFHMTLIHLSLLKKGRMFREMTNSKRTSLDDITFNEKDYKKFIVPKITFVDNKY
ncbi:hypothetical protein SAMN06265376_111107 [Dokdonia pacifica]|uniref:Uncharacterized protein n=2 Tax=Dokdonia pacifica TaxID=1627892 RepID=A0A239DQ30_9FLAO|nr:hypothetical protein SAMN06265376_111107 [Dokdonia pacifica]